MSNYLENIKNTIVLGDCLSVMKKLPDKCIDLVLTDPPYGLNAGQGTGRSHNEKNKKGSVNIIRGDWDKEIPEKEIFNEIFRVSKNQIIWGGNYFSHYLPPSRGWLYWHKPNMCDRDFADGELAFTSFNKNVRRYEKVSMDLERFHPTQKPVEVMQFCLEYAKIQGGIVLDCFSGSASTAIACHNLGLDFICVEKDADYYKASVERLEKHKQQLKLF